MANSVYKIYLEKAKPWSTLMDAEAGVTAKEQGEPLEN